MEPAATKYTLPQEAETWNVKSGLLRSLREAVNLDKAAAVMNEIDEEAVWQPKTLLHSGLGQQRILELLKFAASCALQVENLFPNGIAISDPIKESEGVTWTVLTKWQALCLSTNMFFGTTFKQPNSKDLPVYFTFRRLSRRPTEVVRTYFNYLDRCEKQHKNFNDEHIVFFRIAQTIGFDSWLKCQDKLAEVQFHTSGLIEDLGDAVQIDFANKSIGGFFLSDTYTQEDIIFINNPELMPALLFHRYMRPNECILMVGAQRFSLYEGYLDTYQFAKDFKDERKVRDMELGNGLKVRVKDTWISAIDAIPYFQTSEFNTDNLNRELNKAFVGFHIRDLDGGNKVISTGNWGSGAFNGNLQYKFLIQWLAVSRAHRVMHYYSFQNPQAMDIPDVVKRFKHLTVGQLASIMHNFANKFEVNKKVFNTLMKKGLESLDTVPE